jgi:hypothetical protein
MTGFGFFRCIRNQLRRRAFESDRTDQEAAQKRFQLVSQERAQAPFSQQAIPVPVGRDHFRLCPGQNSLFHGSVGNVPPFGVPSTERAGLKLFSRKIVALGAYGTVNDHSIDEEKRVHFLFR